MRVNLVADLQRATLSNFRIAFAYVLLSASVIVSDPSATVKEPSVSCLSMVQFKDKKIWIDILDLKELTDCR